MQSQPTSPAGLLKHKSYAVHAIPLLSTHVFCLSQVSLYTQHTIRWRSWAARELVAVHEQGTQCARSTLKAKTLCGHSLPSHQMKESACAHGCATRLASPRAMLLRPSLETGSAPMYRPKNASVNCFESTTPACMAPQVQSGCIRGTCSASAYPT